MAFLIVSVSFADNFGEDAAAEDDLLIEDAEDEEEVELIA